MGIIRPGVNQYSVQKQKLKKKKKDKRQLSKNQIKNEKKKKQNEEKNYKTYIYFLIVNINFPFTTPSLMSKHKCSM